MSSISAVMGSEPGGPGTRVRTSQFWPVGIDEQCVVGIADVIELIGGTLIFVSRMKVLLAVSYSLHVVLPQSYR